MSCQPFLLSTKELVGVLEGVLVGCLSGACRVLVGCLSGACWVLVGCLLGTCPVLVPAFTLLLSCFQAASSLTHEYG